MKMLFKFVFRNVRKRLFLNLIKVMGLSLGLSGILFITLFIKNELSYDAYHTKSNRIYRFTTTSPTFMQGAHFARLINSLIIPKVAEHFPEIETYVRLAPIKGGAMLFDEKYYNINEAFVCDSTFFNVFDAELTIGDKATVLNNPGTMIVAESFAKKVFGNENPIGKRMSIPTGQYYEKQQDFTIQGIMKDLPQNSHFHPDLIATPSSDPINWWAYTYLLLKPNSNPGNIIAGYTGFLKDGNDNSDKAQEFQLHLQKITDIHLHSDKLREIENNGNMANIYVLAIAAFILLLISLSNFASLNMGMSVFNLKFININRILGSNKNTNLKYFALESLYILIVSIALMALISIPANMIIHDYFTIDLFKNNWVFIIAIVVAYCILGLLTGLQPVLKQNIRRITQRGESLVHKNIFVSKGIIITQYTLAIVLIVAVIGITKQTHYVLKNSMGDDDSNVLVMTDVHANVQTKFEIFKAELLKHNSIKSVSAMMEPPGGEANDMFQFELDGITPTADENNKNLIGVFPCDYSFASLFNLKFLSGNNFSENNVDAEGSGEYIINETAMKHLGISSPDKAVGRDFKLISAAPGIPIPTGKIIGVIKDVHLSSMKKQVNPMVYFKRDHLWLLNFAVSYQPGMKDQAVADMKTVWNKLFPAYPFHYEAVGAMYKTVYKSELLQAKLLALFTIIALFISSMGLLGISLLVSQQRTKEIGIRKVNGATVAEILQLLNNGFVHWIIIAFIIATPVAWYAMNKWLENFAYKTELSWWIFALAGLLALGIALLTVSWQSWRAATRNPVEALRYE
ncbi:MAG TPA: ABC transporter permease [Prolixibacteraceae bacterium]|nr:ABC transporter permease [Prolixibacteraceae bacterium]